MIVVGVLSADGMRKGRVMTDWIRAPTERPFVLYYIQSTTYCNWAYFQNVRSFYSIYCIQIFSLYLNLKLHIGSKLVSLCV